MTQQDRIMLTYQVTFKSAFHCGTGMAKGVIDRTVIRDKDDYLYIPGSTIKGVLRENCECLARLFDIEIHDPHHPFRNPFFNSEEIVSFLRDEPDIIERIFGSHRQESSLFFDNAWMDEETKKFFKSSGSEKRKRLFMQMQTATRTQTRLSRLTRTVKENALYTSEFGIPELKFEGKIHGCLEGTRNEMAELPGSYPLFLLIASIGMTERIGANRSTGMGSCRFHIQKLMVNGETIEEPQKRYCEALETFILYEDAREEL